MSLPKLRVVGHCVTCRREATIDLFSYRTARHRVKGRWCRGKSAYSSRFLVRNQKEAVLLAEFLKRDGGPGTCLQHHMCTKACNFGKTCADNRSKMATALATYYLTCVSVQE